MRIYRVDVSVTKAGGHQLWEIRAKNKKEAFREFNRGGGNVIEDVLSVNRFDKPLIEDFYEVEPNAEIKIENITTIKRCLVKVGDKIYTRSNANEWRLTYYNKDDKRVNDARVNSPLSEDLEIAFGKYTKGGE